MKNLYFLLFFKKKLAFIFFILPLFCSCVYAFEVSSKSIDSSNLPFEYVVGDYSFEDLESVDIWQPLEGAKFAFGYTHDEYWFRVDLKNSSSEDIELFLEFSEPFAHKLDFYIEDESGLNIFPNGLESLKSALKDSYFLPTTPLNFKPNSKKRIYINYSSRFTSYGAFGLYSAEHLYLKNQIRTALFFFYFGAIAIMIAYNFFLYFSLQDRSYIFYVAYSLVFGIWIFLYSGYGQYLFSGDTIYILHLCTPFAFVFFTLFSRYVLEIDTISHRLKYLFNAFAIVLLLSSIYVVLDLENGYFFANVLGIIYFNFMLYAAIYALYKGVRTAKIYIFALSTYLIFLIFLTLLAIGVIEFSYFTKYSFIFGSLIEILLFSYLLAYRINDIRNMQLDTSNELAKIKKGEADRLRVDIEKNLQELSKSNYWLNKTVQEKEFLLKEVYHRVKNNLQTITSILWLKSNKLNSPEAIDVLNDISFRIQSMSLVHELLYDSNNLNRISSSEYIKKLTESILNSLSNKKVELVRAVDDVLLDTDTAIAIGVVVVEIVTNSIKHAKNDDPLIIFVDLSFNNYIIKLEIIDNGAIEVKSYNTNANTLGLNLVRQMVRKLSESNYSIFYDRGTKFLMEFAYVPST